MRLIFDEERLAYSDAVAPLAFVQEVLRPRLARVRDLAAGPDVYSVEGVHDLRVASRRLRAAIRACAPLLADAAFTALQEIASTITQALGRPRELDVMIKMLEDEETRAVGAWKEAAREAGATLSARRLAAGGRCETAVALAQHIVLPPLGEKDIAAGASPAAHARHDLAHGQSRLVKAWKRWRRHGCPEDLHRVRVAFKKLRYACEVYTPLCPSLEEITGRIKDAQDLLGHWNDCRVLLAELETLKPDPLHAAAHALLCKVFAHRAEEYLAGFALQVEDLFTVDNRK